jgi:hypothetical protein
MNHSRHGFKRGKKNKCPTGKVRYVDHSAAVDNLHAIEGHHKNGDVRDTLPCRVYHCDLCRGWHLTAKGKS